MKFLHIIIIICITQSAFAQVNRAKVGERNLTENAKQLQEQLSESIDAITEDNLYITEKIFLDFDNDPTASVTIINTSIATQSIIDKNIVLPLAYTAIVSKGFEQKKPFVFVQIPRFIKNSAGQIEQLKQYKLELINGVPIKQTRGKRIYAANSVLAVGNWYKVGITTQGLHKIDYDFVKNKMGIDPASITPNAIGLYGNGGEQVAENNNTDRADDLVENAIELVGMQDGKFDNGDYILFYANGPFTILKDSAKQLFHQSINIYSDQSYYFINFAKGNGKRVAVDNFTGIATKYVTSFNDFKYAHKDSINLGTFGQRWWGSNFGNRIGSVKTRNYNFNFPNIVNSEPLHVATTLGAIALNGGTSQFYTTVNGINTGTVSLAPVGTSYTDKVFSEQTISTSVSVVSENVTMQITFVPGDENANGYVDYIEMNARRQLKMSGNSMVFADWKSIGSADIAGYTIENATANTNVWNITNPLLPKKMNANLGSNNLQFTYPSNKLHTFIAFEGNAFNAPEFISKVENQNLHALQNIDYIIVCHPSFIDAANALAQHHQYKRNYSTAVATTSQIYNEFGSGSQDIGAIRDFVKMFYDKASNPNDMPKNMLLFGDASYDYKDRIAGNSNYVPTRETIESNNRISGYCSDDFFGMLDDNENINAYIPNTLDIGIGRLTASDAQEANTFVSKIKIYDSSISYGAWRQNLTFCADNKDNSSHAKDAEIMSITAKDSVPSYNQFKVYIDAFPNYPTPSGDRAPQAKQALDAQIYNGTLVVNYNGHGGPSAWCDERIFTTADIVTYNNINKMPLYITATCDFGAFDNPTLKSGAEKLLAYNKGGAIALMTTTQLVFQYENQIMNRDYWKVGFTPMPNGQMPTLGDAFRRSKNITYKTSSSDLTNFRKFALLGDPGLQLGFAKYKMVADSLNGASLSGVHDTLKSLNVYTLSGRVTDNNGNTITQFNGEADITIYDKEKITSTLGNQVASPKVQYKLQNGIIFKGKTNVKNGVWSNVKFIVPKDIDYTYGLGKISIYASSIEADASGFDTRVVIGGTGNNNIIDNDGPQVKPFMNNNKFANGGITGANSSLLVELSDENGINTSGSGVGHDITAMLDNNTNEVIVLNNFYEGAKDDYKKGIVKYPFRNLSAGKHTLTIKAWDVLNNSGSATLDFVVQDGNTAKLENLYNVPNPFTTNTNFFFEHNFPGEILYVTVQIFSVSGQMIKSIRKVVNSEGSRIGKEEGIEWDGKDELGDAIGKGVYLYKLYYRTQSGISISKYQKLIKL